MVIEVNEKLFFCYILAQESAWNNLQKNILYYKNFFLILTKQNFLKVIKFPYNFFEFLFVF